jgi:hypothetical protein
MDEQIATKQGGIPVCFLKKKFELEPDIPDTENESIASYNGYGIGHEARESTKRSRPGDPHR